MRFTRDVRESFRLLFRTPAFTITAVLSLAIGIGANAAIFTAANGLLIAPTPGLLDMDRLVDIGRSTSGRGFDTVSYATFADLRDRNDVFSGVYAIRIEPRPLSLGSNDGAERVYAEEVSAGYFDVLGIVPARGIVFHASEEHVGQPLRKTVLSDAFWRRRFQADPAIVGHEIVLNSETFVVSGITPPGYRGTTIVTPDLWIPMTAHVRGTSSDEVLRGRMNAGFVMGARLKAGVSRRQAQEAVDAFMTRLTAEYPDVYQGIGLAVLPASRVPGDAGTAVSAFLAVLMALVGLVLLVACSNLAGLLLARGAGRSRDIAVRLALGASRGAVVRMLIVETLVLFSFGAGGGWLLSRVLGDLLRAAIGIVPLPISLNLEPDWRILLFTTVLTLVTGLVTGLTPALHSTRVSLVTDLRSSTPAPRGQRLRHMFLVAQVALGLILMVVAGLLVRALGTATRIDPGFRLEGVDVVSIDLALGGYNEDQSADVAARLRQRLLAVPGVESVGAGAMIALDGGGMGLGALRRRGDTARIETDWNIITPDYLPTIGVPIVRGRNFDSTDRPDGEWVAVINEYMARALFGNADPIGQVLENGNFQPGNESSIRPIRVVGVARDAKYRWLGETPRNFIYVALGQFATRNIHFFVRRSPSVPASASLQPAVRDALHSVDRNLPIVQMQPWQQYGDLGLLPQRIAASMAAGLGLVALFLAAIGIYGVMAYAVASRRREIGVRIALGADPARVMRHVMGQALRLTAIGGVIGLAGALVMSRVIASLLFGVSPSDPLTFGATLLALFAVVAAASAGPARRAARVEPVIALKAD
jgi:putative ABC transport system permease protein